MLLWYFHPKHAWCVAVTKQEFAHFSKHMRLVLHGITVGLAWSESHKSHASHWVVLATLLCMPTVKSSQLWSHQLWAEFEGEKSWALWAFVTMGVNLYSCRSSKTSAVLDIITAVLFQSYLMQKWYYFIKSVSLTNLQTLKYL